MKIFELGVEVDTLSALDSAGFFAVTRRVRAAEDLHEWLRDSGCEALIINLDKIEGANFHLRYLRSKGLTLAIVGLSRPGYEPWSTTRMRFLDDGGDDLLRSPPDPQELLASIHASIRRDKRLSSRTRSFTFGDVTLDVNFTRQRVEVNNHVVKLTKIEFRILEFLTLHPGLLKNRNELMDAAYDEAAIDDRTVDSHIKRMRGKFARAHPDARHMIETCYGLGYRIPIDELKRQVA